MKPHQIVILNGYEDIPELVGRSEPSGSNRIARLVAERKANIVAALKKRCVAKKAAGKK